MSTFKELLQASFKSNDTEEWLDIHFNRPIGLIFALLWNKLGVHPNAITILSIFLGVGAGWMFYHTDLSYNIAGVILLVFANFCDSTDGQMARLTGKKTLVGRVLDGASGDVWFLTIYVALCLRMQGQTIPGLELRWGVWIWILAAIAGLICHSPQSRLADYYRQIHLYFLKGETGSEFDHSSQQMKVYKETPKKQVFARIFFKTYAGYCSKQEKESPQFQQFFALWKQTGYSLSEEQQASVREQFLEGSRPLMAYANILTFNTRAIMLYITCLLNCPWVYFVFEMTVLQVLYVYMRHRHERLCEKLIQQLKTITTE